jgi:translation initiation factor 1
MEMAENGEKATAVYAKKLHNGAVDEVNRSFPNRHARRKFMDSDDKGNLSNKDSSSQKVNKKKPIKLEWQGGLLEHPGSGSSLSTASDVKPVSIRGKSSTNSNAVPASQRGDSSAVNWKGTLKVRREVKGRGGKPVAVLFEFKPPQNSSQLESLCRTLKEKLACGGTVDEQTIVVQVDSFKRVAEVLKKLGIECLAAGGF